MIRCNQSCNQACAQDVKSEVKRSKGKEEKKEKKCLPSYKLNFKNVPKPAAAKPRLRTILAPRSISTYVEWMSPMARHSWEVVLSFCFSFSFVGGCEIHDL